MVSQFKFIYSHAPQQAYTLYVSICLIFHLLLFAAASSSVSCSSRLAVALAHSNVSDVQFLLYLHWNLVYGVFFMHSHSVLCEWWCFTISFVSTSSSIFFFIYFFLVYSSRCRCHSSSFSFFFFLLSAIFVHVITIII